MEVELAELRIIKRDSELASGLVVARRRARLAAQEAKRGRHQR